MHTKFAFLMSSYDIALPHLPDFDFSCLETERNRLRQNTVMPEVWKLNNDGRVFQVGEAMRARGLDAEYPVVLIPGIISTNLESWSTDLEYRPFFRQRVGGGFNVMSQVMFNKDNWITQLMLDTDTGLNAPGGVKVRAAEGIDAASSFVQGSRERDMVMIEVGGNTKTRIASQSETSEMQGGMAVYSGGY
jgi:phospholipid:diacylglycerol acyltransferase